MEDEQKLFNFTSLDFSAEHFKDLSAQECVDAIDLKSASFLTFATRPLEYHKDDEFSLDGHSHHLIGSCSVDGSNYIWIQKDGTWLHYVPATKKIKKFKFLAD